MTASKIRAITFVLIPWVLIPSVTVATNYFPLATVPEWQESMKTMDSWGEEYVYHSRNLISVGGTGPVIPIIPPIQFGNVLIETEYDWSNPLLEGGSLVAVTSSEVSGSALKRMQQASSGTCAAGLSCRIENYWETNLDWTNPRRGVPQVLPDVRIGQVYTDYYIQEATSIVEGNPGLGLEGYTEETVVRTRSRTVYAGVDTVENLYPGADITLATGPYQALVSIQELDMDITTTTYPDNGSPPTVDQFSSSATNVSWLVDNIGPVKMVSASGPWLDDLLSAPAFDSGDGVVVVGGFEAVLPEVFIDTTILRMSGGNVGGAADADISTGWIQLYDLADMPWLGDNSSNDADRDGVADSLDDFPVHTAASLDTDNDGKPDEWHSFCGNTCQVASGLVLDQDDDNDGMPDTFEVQYNLNPLDASDADNDSDTDGHTNLEEYQAGTNPRDSQSIPKPVFLPFLQLLLD